jgi:glycerol-3-phosphate dehydrogenase
VVAASKPQICSMGTSERLFGSSLVAAFKQVIAVSRPFTMGFRYGLATRDFIF